MSSLTLSLSVGGSSPPDELTGDAAPMLVAGAITAKLAATVMNVPADAACAPAGETKTATGARDPRIASIMLRMESARPPGVSSSITISAAPSSAALSIALER